MTTVAKNIYPNRTVPFTSTQELLDFVAAHLLRPGATRSFDSLLYKTCVYRTEDGNRCAIGACINDADYKDTFETVSLGSFSPTIVPQIAAAAGIDLANTDMRRLAEDLQSKHDARSNWDSPLAMALALRSLAITHFLSAPAIVTAITEAAR